MSDGWGVAQSGAKRRASRGGQLNPHATRAGHKGIVRIHVVGVWVWLFVALVLGALSLAGKQVPAVALVIGLAAAAGHSIFLLVHLVLARLARQRLDTATAASGNGAPGDQASG